MNKTLVLCILWPFLYITLIIASFWTILLINQITVPQKSFAESSPTKEVCESKTIAHVQDEYSIKQYSDCTIQVDSYMQGRLEYDVTYPDGYTKHYKTYQYPSEVFSRTDVTFSNLVWTYDPPAATPQQKYTTTKVTNPEYDQLKCYWLVIAGGSSYLDSGPCKKTINKIVELP